MIYLPCDHQAMHNGGWVEELHVSIGGREEVIAIAPCRLLCARAGRPYSWLATLTVILHRKIVHEEVLRQLLALRYGNWFRFWSISEFMHTIPVFYQHRANRYYLLRDVVPFLPRLNRIQRKIQPRVTKGAAPQISESVYKPVPHTEWASRPTQIPVLLPSVSVPKFGGHLRTADS
ncbi:MAG: hypothetical protein WCC92_22325 [Candidatus Korobacteraceae bacterium]